MNKLEVAVGKLVALLGVIRLTVVDSEVPLPVLGESVCLDEGVLLSRRWLMLAPGIALVPDGFAVVDQSLRVLHGGSVELYCHPSTLTSDGRIAEVAVIDDNAVWTRTIEPPPPCPPPEGGGDIGLMNSIRAPISAARPRMFFRPLPAGARAGLKPSPSSRVSRKTFFSFPRRLSPQGFGPACPPPVRR